MPVSAGVSLCVKHCLDFSFVFSAPLPAWRNLFSASWIFCGGRYQPQAHVKNHRRACTQVLLLYKMPTCRFSQIRVPLTTLVERTEVFYVWVMDMKERFILRSLGLMEQPLLSDNYVFSLFLRGISWSGSHAFEISLCGLHSEWHMDMNQVPPVPPNQDLNPLLLQIKNSEWTTREWFMPLIDSCRKQWVIVHLLNCNFHQQVPSTYLFIMCLPTHSQTFKGAQLDL
jgi:hypothetical protein